MAAELLGHPGEYVRAWVIRLLGDRQTISPALASRLADLAEADTSVVVRAQLAASARRLPAAEGLSVVERLRPSWPRSRRPVYTALALVVRGTEGPQRSRPPCELLRQSPVMGRSRASRACDLARAAVRGGEVLRLDTMPRRDCSRPFPRSTKITHSPRSSSVLPVEERRLEGWVWRGCSGRSPSRRKPRRPPRVRPNPSPLAWPRPLNAAWREQTGDLVRLRLAVRAGTPGALSSLVAQTAAPESTTERRLSLLSTLAEFGGPESLSVALALLQNESTREIQSAALDVIARVGGDQATEALLDRYRARRSRDSKPDSRGLARSARFGPRISEKDRERGVRSGGRAGRATPLGSGSWKPNTRRPRSQALGQHPARGLPRRNSPRCVA